MPLFHVQTGIPSNVELPYGRLVLRYTRHALREARKDRHKALAHGLPGEILAYKHQLVEVETDAETGKLTKAVYRVGVTRDLDAVLVVSPRNDRWVVRTVWGNEKGDTHKTLNTSRYTPVANMEKVAA